jgi:hypothetical protein
LDTAAAREGQPRKKRARRKATPASVAPTPPVPAAPPLDDTTVYHARAVMLDAIDNDQGGLVTLPRQPAAAPSAIASDALPGAHAASEGTPGPCHTMVVCLLSPEGGEGGRHH